MTRIVATMTCFLLLTIGAGPSWGQVLLNEILAGPSTDWNGDSTYSYRDDEWIEIYNAGSTSVDMSPYWLSDADSTLLFNFSGVLGSHCHEVVYGGDAVEWQRATGRSAVGLRLNNSGDTVMLWAVEAGSLGVGLAARTQEGPTRLIDDALHQGAGAAVVDSYTYMSHEAGADRSSGRVPDGGDFWEVFDGLNPYGGSQEPQGNGCPPTPASDNGCPTPVSARSWGSVKALYRLKE
jgi:hypothetical protein